jgi:DNA-binding NtrC family response regulator
VEIRTGLDLATVTESGKQPELILLPEEQGLEDALADYEKKIIVEALNRTRWNVLQSALILKIPRGTLRYKMEKYGL